jgi:hypothetical protein
VTAIAARVAALFPATSQFGIVKDGISRYPEYWELSGQHSDLMRLPVPAPANGHTDSTTEAVRLVDVDRPGGLVLPVAVLRDQVVRIHAQRRACQFAEVATDLPELIPSRCAGIHWPAR